MPTIHIHTARKTRDCACQHGDAISRFKKALRTHDRRAMRDCSEELHRLKGDSEATRALGQAFEEFLREEEREPEH